MNVDDKDIKDILLKYKIFSVYGLSDSPQKPSHYVPLYMREQGWEIVGTYPKSHDVNGFKIYENLKDVPAENPCKPFVLPPIKSHFPFDCANANECIAGVPGIVICSSSIE